VAKSVPEREPDKIEKPEPLYPTAFIGSMKGTMDVTDDIVSPIDVVWEADQGCDQDHLL
jgi:hypothetical protein